MLQLFIPRSSKQKLRANIRTALIDPALALAHNMNLSVDSFTVEWTEFCDAHPEQQPARTYPFHEQSNQFEMVNLMAAGKTIKNLSGPGHLDYVMDIMPQLVMKAVRTDEFGEAKILKRPKLLVAVPKEGESRLMPPKLKPGEDATLLGWLHRAVRESGRGLLRK
jgi:hypothetical protein